MYEMADTKKSVLGPLLLLVATIASNYRRVKMNFEFLIFGRLGMNSKINRKFDYLKYISSEDIFPIR